MGIRDNIWALAVVAILGIFIVSSLPTQIVAEPTGAPSTFSIEGYVVSADWTEGGDGVLLTQTGTTLGDSVMHIYSLDGSSGITLVGNVSGMGWQVKFGPTDQIVVVGTSQSGEATATLLDYSDGTVVNDYTDATMFHFTACDYNPVNTEWLLAGQDYELIETNADLSNPTVSSLSSNTASIVNETGDNPFITDIEWRPGSSIYAYISLYVDNFSWSGQSHPRSFFIGYKSTTNLVYGPFWLQGINNFYANIEFWTDSLMWATYHTWSYAGPSGKDETSYYETYPMLFSFWGDDLGFEWWDDGWRYEDNYTTSKLSQYNSHTMNTFFDPASRTVTLAGYGNGHSGHQYESYAMTGVLKDLPYDDHTWAWEFLNESILPTLEWDEDIASIPEYENEYVSYFATYDAEADTMLFGDIGSVTVDSPGLVNHAPQVTLQSSYSVVVNDTFSLSKPVVVNDPDGDDTEWMVEWGDGDTMAWTASSTASHVYDGIGDYTINVTARDTGNLTASDTAVVSVVEALPVITVGTPEYPSSISPSEGLVVTIEVSLSNGPATLVIENDDAVETANEYVGNEFEWRVENQGGTILDSGNTSTVATTSLENDATYYVYLMLDTTGYEGNVHYEFLVGLEGSPETVEIDFEVAQTGGIDWGQKVGGLPLWNWPLVAVAILILLVVLFKVVFPRREEIVPPKTLTPGKGGKVPLEDKMSSSPVEKEQTGTIAPRFEEAPPTVGSSGGSVPIKPKGKVGSVKVKKKGKGYVLKEE